MKIGKHYFTAGSEENFTSYLIEDSAELQPGKKRPAVVVCPGGGYLFLSDREAEPIAMQFLSRGWQAFVLNYHCGSEDGRDQAVLKTDLVQLATTIRSIREHADEWNVAPDKIVLIGFSAGGHLVASMSGQWYRDWLTTEAGVTADQLRFAAAVLAYPVIDVEIIDRLMDERGPSWDGMRTFVGQMNTAMSGENHPYGHGDCFYAAQKNVSRMTPPTFICHAADDGLIYVRNSLAYASALEEAQVPFEMHIFERGGHGFSLANAYSSNEEGQMNAFNAHWVEAAFDWLTYHVQY